MNLCEVYVGRPGTGKSTLAARRCRELHPRAYVLVHNAGGGFPSAEAGFVREHATIEDCKRSLAGSGGTAIHVVNDRACSPTVFLRLAWTLSETSEARGFDFPCVAVFDESVMLLWAEDPREVRIFRGLLVETVVRRRHIGCGVGLIMTTQHSNLLSYHALEQASRIVMFQTTGGYCIQKLRMAGVPEEMLERLPGLSLDRHEHMEWAP